MEFITAFLNNAANQSDITNGTKLAATYKIPVLSPKFGISRADYACDVETRRIAKGLSSVKFLSGRMAEELYRLSKEHSYESFTSLLLDISASGCVDSRQLVTLIHIDFFSDFGNQRELENIVQTFEFFKHGAAKQVRKDLVAGTALEEIIRRHSTGTRADGTESSFYKLTDVRQILEESEKQIKSLGIGDFDVVTKARYFAEIMGYTGYTSGSDDDRATLYVREVMPLKRKSDGAQFAHAVCTQSLGSGIECRFTVFNNIFNKDPIHAADVIQCTGYRREKGKYFTMTGYRHIYHSGEAQ